jgi:hypothetical protein
VIDALAELSATQTRPHRRRQLRLSTTVAGLGAIAGARRAPAKRRFR